MEKSTKCKFCGKTAVGKPAADASATVRNGKKICRGLGTIGSLLRLDPISAYSFASGKTEKGFEEAGSNIMGGILYHFKCTNPECGQSFDKMVL